MNINKADISVKRNIVVPIGRHTSLQLFGDVKCGMALDSIIFKDISQVNNLIRLNFADLTKYDELLFSQGRIVNKKYGISFVEAFEGFKTKEFNDDFASDRNWRTKYDDFEKKYRTETLKLNRCINDREPIAFIYSASPSELQCTEAFFSLKRLLGYNHRLVLIIPDGKYFNVYEIKNDMIILGSRFNRKNAINVDDR